MLAWQSWCAQCHCSAPVPRVRLVASERVFAAAGERVTVALSIVPETHAAVLDNGFEEIYDGREGGCGGARLHCRFALKRIHFISYSLTYSVPLYLERQCDRTPGCCSCLWAAGSRTARASGGRG